jgi:outer membrane biosynthesis protein TonB
MTASSPRPLAARLRTAAASAVVIAGTLVGCTSGGPLVPPATTAQLQAGVLSVTASAASGDYAGAQAALAGLEAALATAVDDGGLTEAQAARIRDAIALIEADLAALTAPAPSTVTPGTPAPATDEASSPPVDTPAPEATATPTPAPTTPPPPPATSVPTPTPTPTPTAEPTPTTPDPGPTPDPAAPGEPDDNTDTGDG